MKLAPQPQLRICRVTSYSSAPNVARVPRQLFPTVPTLRSRRSPPLRRQRIARRTACSSKAESSPQEIQALLSSMSLSPGAKPYPSSLLKGTSRGSSPYFGSGMKGNSGHCAPTCTPTRYSKSTSSTAPGSKNSRPSLIRQQMIARSISTSTQSAVKARPTSHVLYSQKNLTKFKP